MRTKDFIYYASAAVLMVVTTQVASADEDADYYKFIEPITARYVKFDLLSSWGCELYEIYVFK